MNRHKHANTLAVAALAAIAIAAASPADAARRGAAPPVDSVGDVKSANDLDIALALDSETAAGDNDSFASAKPIAAPNDDRFALRGELTKTDGDGMCRDVDFFTISGLAPSTSYNITQFGDINDKMIVGVFDESGQITAVSDLGKVSATADADGVIVIAGASAEDQDFDGANDSTAQPHGLCGGYYLVIELPVLGDLTGDSAVNVDDVRAMLALFGDTDSPQADLDLDGIVDSDDLRIIADLVTDKKGRRIANNKATKFERQAKRQGLSKEEVARRSKLLSQNPIDKDTPADSRSR
ncbi:MAG: hypothetical protein H6813_06300 [Phycisphaeraceae bacterium]|nr:hypothetical protein [Phycisphaeraceae bacterium]MCB9848082.1 hypothetical protein [Phycisphaeraceae bacterium]